MLTRYRCGARDTVSRPLVPWRGGWSCPACYPALVAGGELTPAERAEPRGAPPPDPLR